MMVETYLRRGKRSLERMLLDPRVRGVGSVLGYSGSGFLLSAASLGGYPHPLAMGLICTVTGWRALVMSMGAMIGYPTFWGSRGNQGIVWSAAGGLLALLVGKKQESKDQPLMIPAIAAFLTAVAGLSFQMMLKDTTPVTVYLLRIALSFFSGVLFTQFGRCRDAVTDWVVGGVAVLALAQISLGRLGLGYVAAGMMAVGSAFPAVALAGLALDLAQITAVPMTAVACLAYFIGLIPFDKKWQHYAAPAIACAGVCAACGIWDMTPLPGMALGGAMGALLPPRTAATRRRGETGVAQVRLELGSQMLASARQLLEEICLPCVDEEALMNQVRCNACDGCSARGSCTQRETLKPELMQHPLEADCRKQGRLIPELRRAEEKRRLLAADHRRRAEYSAALIQQYGFLSEYLRSLADGLPRGGKRTFARFRVDASCRSQGKEGINGDRCVSFYGTDCKYYLLLCDGMGTGTGAAREGSRCGSLLQKMLTAGFPAEHALQSLNSFLVLRGNGGAVTVDLAELHLDTGHARLYKWGAAPSYVLTRAGTEKIGTATPPPGLTTEESHMAVRKLSLRRGEVLIVVSDGVDGEGIQHLSDLSPDLPPGELAAKLLESGRGRGEDDATVAVVRLHPNGLGTE